MLLQDGAVSGGYYASHVPVATATPTQQQQQQSKPKKSLVERLNKTLDKLASPVTAATSVSPHQGVAAKAAVAPQPSVVWHSHRPHRVNHHHVRSAGGSRLSTFVYPWEHYYDYNGSAEMTYDYRTRLQQQYSSQLRQHQIRTHQQQQQYFCACYKDQRRIFSNKTGRCKSCHRLVPQSQLQHHQLLNRSHSSSLSSYQNPRQRLTSRIDENQDDEWSSYWVGEEEREESEGERTKSTNKNQKKSSVSSLLGSRSILDPSPNPYELNDTLLAGNGSRASSDSESVTSSESDPDVVVVESKRGPLSVVSESSEEEEEDERRQQEQQQEAKLICQGEKSDILGGQSKYDNSHQSPLPGSSSTKGLPKRNHTSRLKKFGRRTFKVEEAIQEEDEEELEAANLEVVFETSPNVKSILKTHSPTSSEFSKKGVTFEQEEDGERLSSMGAVGSTQAKSETIASLLDLSSHDLEKKKTDASFALAESGAVGDDEVKKDESSAETGEEEKKEEEDWSDYDKVIVSHNLAEEILDEIYGKLIKEEEEDDTNHAWEECDEVLLSDFKKRSMAEEILEELYGRNEAKLQRTMSRKSKSSSPSSKDDTALLERRALLGEFPSLSILWIINYSIPRPRQ